MAVAAHAEHITHNLNGNQILFAQLHFRENFMTDRNIVVALPFWQKIADKAHVIKAYSHRRVSHLLAHLPHIKGYGNGILIFPKLHSAFKFILHVVTPPFFIVFY